MKYTILEDHSPYYIKFTYDGISEMLEYMKKYRDISTISKSFVPRPIDANDSRKILNFLPMRSEINLHDSIVLFVTPPGLYYPAHRDGIDCKWSLNFYISIKDSNCVTSWYDNQELTEFYQSNTITDKINRSSRELLNFDKSKHKPVMTYEAKEGDCVLFNTDIFHDFDNTLSSNYRILLPLREKGNPRNFDQIKRLFFNI